MSSPGITFMQEFITAKKGWHIGKNDTYDYNGRTGKFKKSKNDFSLDYYNYSSRGLISDEAAPQFIAYKLPENESSGNFDCDMDLLGAEQIEYYRDLERKSLAAGCPKYLGVISFDNDFLKEFNIITKDDMLNVGRLRELTRMGMNGLISASKKLDNDNVYWTAGIHMDTDNIHIHLDFLEYERREDRDKIYPDKDKLEVKAFDRLKSKIGNGIIGPERIIAISKMEREILPAQISDNYMSCAEQLAELALKLPPPNSEGKWEYGRLGKYQRDVNKTVDAVIMSNPQLKEQFFNYLKMLDDHMELDRRMYGEGERQLWCNFKKNRLKDFRNKTGNALLKYLPEVRDAAMNSDYGNFSHLSEEKIPSGYVDNYIRRSDRLAPDDGYYDRLLMDEQSELPGIEELIPPAGEEQFPDAENPPDGYLEALYEDIPPEQPLSEDTSDFYEHLISEFVDERYDDQALLRLKEPLMAYVNATEYERMTDKNGVFTELLNVKRELDDELALAEIYSAHDFTDEQKKLIAEGFHNGLSNVILEQINENFTSQQIITYFDMYDRAVKGEIDPHDVQVYLDEQCPATRGTPEKRTDPFIEWTEEYKNALAIMYSKNPDFDEVREILLSESNAGNALATHDLGKLYGNKLIDVPDGKKLAQRYYSQAFKEFCSILNADNAINARNLPEKKIQSIEWETAYLNYRIGKMYNRGLGTEQDQVKAREHYLAAGGNKYAEFALGNIYKYGSGTDINYAESLRHYQKSADQGMPFADYALGTAYENGQGTDADKVKSEQHYAKALDGFLKIYEKSPDDTIAYKVGIMYCKGKGTDVDLKKAEEFLSLSAKANNSNAQYMLGKLYIDEKRFDEALEVLTAAADKNNNDFAQFALGKLYLTDELRNLVLAEYYLTEAADKNNNQFAQYTLGKHYLGYYEDYDKAEEYFRKAAYQDNEFAQYALGKLYLTKERWDLALAGHYLIRAADEHNNQFAQYTLGQLYLQNNKNYDKAEEYFRKAAYQDNEFAQHALGKLYLTKERWDLALAGHYLSKSADEHNNPYAQYDLGTLYEDLKNTDKANEYYAKAFNTFLEKYKQSHDNSTSYKLGIMYFKGKGTVADLEKAESYLLKPAKDDNEYAQYALGKLYLTEQLYDPAKAEQFLIKAADDHNNPLAQYELGKLYLKEYSDYYKAEKYFLLAAEQEDDKDNEFAQYQLGKLYSSPPKEQPELAIKYYKLAADKHKNQYAQYRLGKIYMSEEHLNYSAAEQYLSASEAQGNEAACYLLGRLYLTEEHQDLSKAEQFLTKAADKYNNPYAQYTLGKFYLSEDRYDRDMAEEYLLRSALQNNSAAQLRLGLLYMKENNSEAASYWIRAAAEQGNEIALDILSRPPKREVKVSPQYRIAKGNLARASYNALKKIYGEMDRHVRKLLAEAAREEEQERFKNNRKY